MAVRGDTVVGLQGESFPLEKISGIKSIIEEEPEENLALWLTATLPEPVEMGGHHFITQHYYVSFGITEIVVAPDVGPLILVSRITAEGVLEAE